ncbi:MAG: DUF4097 family beta strand repeat-containing protein [Candidatus Eisenbacteria bacterium]
MHATILRVLTGGALVATAATAHADDWNRTYPVTGHPRLEVVTDDAQVRVTVGDPHTVGIHVHTEGWKIESGGISIRAEQTGDQIRFEAREPHFNWGIYFHSRHVEIDLTVPTELALDIETGDGDVTLAPLGGAVRVHTGDGAVSAEGLHGDLRLESGDGQIRARDLEGHLFAHTGDGSIAVSGRFTGLELSSGDGRIEATVTSGSKVSETWSLHTGDGSIVLRVPRDLAADLEADTGDGSIDADLPVSVEGRLVGHHMHGHLNGGGELLRLRSGDGNIHIAAL